MINFEIDKDKNRGLIKISGTVSYDDASQNLTTFIDVCNSLGVNFTIVNDLSEIMIQSEEELITLNKVHLKLLDLFMVGSVIRIIDKSSTIFDQLTRIDKEFDLSKIEYVETLEEAIALAEKE